MGEAFRLQRQDYPPNVSPAEMAEQVWQFAPASGAEALKILRASYPGCPLSARVAALDALMRRSLR